MEFNIIQVNEYRTKYDEMSKEIFNVLFIDENISEGQRHSLVFELEGCVCTVLTSVTNLVSYEFLTLLSTLDVIIIEESFRSNPSLTNDISNIRNVCPHIAIIMLMSSRFEKTNLILFDGNIIKPIVKTSIDIIRNIIVGKFASVIFPKLKRFSQSLDFPKISLDFRAIDKL